MGKRRARTVAQGGPTRSSKRLKDAQGRPQAPLRPKSVWQDPEHPILESIFEQLLAQSSGKRWVRVASHVCSYWRAAAQDVLLADTAMSRPERPPMPTAPSQAFTKPCDTVQTQAAVVLEASNSTGFEAVSKQHPDNPAPSWVAGPSGFQGGQQPRGAAAGAQSRRPQPRQRQRRAVPAAAHAPAAQPAAAAAAPAGGQQGSIESGMAVRRQAPMSDSESDGSTGARQPPSAARGRGAAWGRGAGGRRGREQEEPPQAVLQQLARAGGPEAGAGAAVRAGDAAEAPHPAAAPGQAPGGGRRRVRVRRQWAPSAELAGPQEQPGPSTRAGGRAGLRRSSRAAGVAPPQADAGPSGVAPSGRRGSTLRQGGSAAVQGPSPAGGDVPGPSRRRRGGQQAQQASDVAAMVLSGRDSESESDVEMPARPQRAQQREQQGQALRETGRGASPPQPPPQEHQQEEEEMAAAPEAAPGEAGPGEGAAAAAPQPATMALLPRYLANLASWLRSGRHTAEGS